MRKPSAAVRWMPPTAYRGWPCACRRPMLDRTLKDGCRNWSSVLSLGRAGSVAAFFTCVVGECVGESACARATMPDDVTLGDRCVKAQHWSVKLMAVTARRGEE